MRKKIWSANYGEDGFALDYYSDEASAKKDDFISNLESGFKKNVIETIVQTSHARANFNYIKSSGPSHSHNHYEIDLVLAGSVYESDGVHTNLLQVNDAVVVSPHNHHSYTKVDGDESYTLFLNIALQKEFFVDKMKIFFGFNFPTHVALTDEEVSMIVGLLMEAHNNKKENKSDIAELMIQNVFNTVVSIFLIHLSKNSVGDDEHFNDNMINAIMYINENFYEKINCDDVAKKCGYSPNYFSAMFKLMMGITFSEYLCNVRLERAKYLLVATKTSISVISSECGFSSSSYFSKLFKEKIGMTPQQYRIQESEKRNNI